MSVQNSTTGLRYDATDEIDAYFRQVGSRFEEGKRRFMAQAGEIMREEVTSKIAAGVNDSHGNVQSWQKVYLGEHGGYAAVRPIGPKDGGSSGADSEIAVTNYLERGHRTRTATGAAKRQRKGRAKQAYVDGRHFYREAGVSAEAKLIAAAEAFMDSVAGEDA